MFGPVPEVSPGVCVVIFKHEFADPVKFVMTSPRMVHDLIHAQSKLVGDLQVIHACNQHGVVLPLSHVSELGQISDVTCEDTHHSREPWPFGTCPF